MQIEDIVRLGVIRGVLAELMLSLPDTPSGLVTATLYQQGMATDSLVEAEAVLEAVLHIADSAGTGDSLRSAIDHYQHDIMSLLGLLEEKIEPD